MVVRCDPFCDPLVLADLVVIFCAGVAVVSGSSGDALGGNVRRLCPILGCLLVSDIAVAVCTGVLCSVAGKC